jgi:hypothetical protein
MKKYLIVLFIILAGCAHGPQSGNPAYRFAVDIPEGWRQLHTDKYFIITRDGAYLQYFLVQERPLDRPFKHTRKRLGKDMLPQEVADVIIAEITSDKNILNFELIENFPATINGHSGFKMLFTYKDLEGSTSKTLYYGFMADQSFYNLRFTAAKRHYFERDLATFVKFVDSFELIDMEMR